MQSSLFWMGARAAHISVSSERAAAQQQLCDLHDQLEAACQCVADLEVAAAAVQQMDSELAATAPNLMDPSASIL